MGGTPNVDGVTTGEAGKAYLYPGHVPVPAFQVAHEMTSFSPDGQLLLVGSNQKATRPSPGAAWVDAKPELIVFSVPDLKVVQRFVGFDPSWAGPRAIHFRKGSQAFSVEVGKQPVAVGIAQTGFACPDEQFGPKVPCKSGVRTRFDGGDANQTFWLVDTYNEAAGSRHDHIDVLDLMSGGVSVMHTVDDPTDEGHYLYSPAISPNAKRACAWQNDLVTKPGTAQLICTSLPSVKSERVLTVSAQGGQETLFIDDDLLFISADGFRLVDLAHGTSTRVEGIPAGASGFGTVPGTKKVFFFRPTVQLVDLDQKTTVDTQVKSSTAVQAVPGNTTTLLVKNGESYWDPAPFELWSE